MSSVTGVSLNAIFPSGLVDRNNVPPVPPTRQESPLFTTVNETEATERGQNRREMDPDERRQDNQRGRPLTPSARNESAADSDINEPRTREELEQARRQGELDAEERAKLEEIQRLSERDREVRNHEQAHQAVGGQYAGPVSYNFVQGPDGRRYAVSGEVPIDLSPADSPERTIAKMEQVRRAAMAPAEPSPADLQVAAEATQLMLDARAELLRQQRLEAAEQAEAREALRNESVRESADDEQDRAENDEERDEALDEIVESVNTEAQARLSRVQAAIAELLRNQSSSLDQVTLGRNINFQI